MNIQTKFRVAIINHSGSIGKTTVARHLLKPRMQSTGDIIYIESLNADQETKDGVVLVGSQFERVSRKLMESVSAIVDVGASNVETAFSVMREIEGSHEDFDYVVVPAKSVPKQRADTINTLKELIRIGIEPERIKVIFNHVQTLENVEESFADILACMEALGIEYIPDAVIYENQFFRRYENLGITSLDDIFKVSLEDNKAKQEKLRRLENRTDEQTTELRSLNNLITLQRNAQTAIQNLDLVYQALFTIKSDKAETKSSDAQPQSAPAKVAAK